MASFRIDVVEEFELPVTKTGCGCTALDGSAFAAVVLALTGRRRRR